MTANLPAPNLTTLQLSPELWRLLAEDRAGLEDIRRNPVMVEECQRYARQLDLICEPAGGDLVARTLAPLVLVFGLGDQATSPQFWRVYSDALSDLPRISLERAVSEYQRAGKFFPKPAEIRDLAMPHALAFRQAAYRAKKAGEPVEEPKPVTERVDPEKFWAEMKAFAAVMESKDIFARTKNRQVRPLCARVDNTGISQEMRAKLAEQRADMG